ncbi:MAG TPA: hypothetical protein VKX28_03210 [Xanthobacteraceae bacterium]|nr:hypothetical protein [Xanthobacteraceae bacterium]
MIWRRGLVTMALALAPLGALHAQERAVPPHLPSGVEAAAVCNMIAARGPAIAPMLVKDGVLDANNDGLVDDVMVTPRDGTMRGEDLAYRPHGAAKGTKPINATATSFQPNDYFPFGARWLPFGGKVYTLYFDAEDLRYPSYLGFIDAANTEHLVCDFDHSEHETFAPIQGVDRPICRAVARRQVSYAEVAAPRDPNPNDVDAASRRWSSRIVGHVMVDFANTGVPAALALVAFESGAGRGCDLNYFDAVVDGKLARGGDAHAMLMKLQDVELSDQGDQDYTQSRCDGSTPRWFVLGGVTYLDIAGGPDVRGVEPFHEVRRLRAGRIETLCKGSFAVSWKLKSIGREFRQGAAGHDASAPSPR